MNLTSTAIGTDPNKTILGEEKLCSWVIKTPRSVYVPSSLYRVQMNHAFTFNDARALVTYWKDLGIEAVYCSPYFEAVPGSMHGYNVADPNKINSEIGSAEEHGRFCAALAASGMGHIIDVVPNHMGISGNNNNWWMDVLENGQSSIYAGYFDIDWELARSELKGKVLLPVLGDFYGRVLENQELVLAFEKGAFRVLYYERFFPIDPQTYPVILEYGLEELEECLGRRNGELLEYLSVITAFRNLPLHTESGPEKSAERNREKEIGKARLAALVERSLAVREFVDSRLKIFNGHKADPRSFDLLDGLLNRQAYRMGLWSVAAQEINYRRFFNINDLAAIHTEDEKVFLHYHQLLFKLIREGKVSGLRIDHPDGLYDPPAYFRALQRECLLQMILREWDEDARSLAVKPDPVDVVAARRTLDKLLANGFSVLPGFFVVAEKILDRKEQLPDNWNIHGTVGYDFLNALNGLFVDRQNEAAFALLYEKYIGHKIDFEELVYAKKKFFALVHMASEINALGNRLDKISETNRLFRDFTRNDLTLAIREVIACFPVYRTYVSPEATEPSEKETQYIVAAVEKAKKKTPALNPAVYDFLRDVLLFRVRQYVAGEEGRLYKDFILRFQQLTGPIMAKGVEDTSFYIYNRLVSLNEVGGDPFNFGYSRDDFHARNIQRNKRWPYSVIASSTHDTKRSEDVRARINVLSEEPAAWESQINAWAELNRKYKIEINGVPEPRRNTEYYLYQILIGVWPDRPLKEEDFPAFMERIWQVILKSIREAKIYTSWVRPQLEYEETVKAFTCAILKPGQDNVFLPSLLDYQKRVAFYGKLNSLSASLLKLASPGVMDTYQGDELWNYCLVDPDNRGPVDFDRRRKLLRAIDDELAAGRPFEDLWEAWGRQEPDKMKLFIISRGLRFRRDNKEVFLGGEYLPVQVQGEMERHVMAFIRKRGEKLVLAAAGRFFTGLTVAGGGYALPPGVWKDTRLALPAGVLYPPVFKDVLTGHMVKVQGVGESRFIGAGDLFKYTCTGLLA